ncbi:MAG: CoB--CoM heterodisulfide reductase subunit C [Candidatus Lokiarchaeota archaeon]|jgi:heterodisulfide reductase subunit C
MSIVKPKVITKIKSNLNDLMKKEGLKGIGGCIQCGTCSGSCPSGRRTALSVRRIIRKIQLGIDDVLSSDDIWYCSTCYTCYERCPRNIPITDAIIHLRNLAVQNGYMHKSHVELCKKLIETGHGVPNDDSKWSDLREFYGLERIPPTVHSDDSALEEVQKLVMISDFDSLIDIKTVETEEDLSMIEVLHVVEDGIPKIVVHKESQNQEKSIKQSVS